MNNRTSFPLSFITVLSFTIVLALTTLKGEACQQVNEPESLEEIITAQHNELELLKEKITAQYKLMYAKRKKGDEIPPGVTNLVMRAIRRRVFQPNQDIKDFEKVFGKDKMFEFKSNNKRIVMIPLDWDDSQLTHLGTLGTQWHLMLELDLELKVNRISIEDTSLKILLMIHNIKTIPYQNQPIKNQQNETQ